MSKKNEPDPGPWTIGAYYRNDVFDHTIRTVFGAPCKPFKVRCGAIWLAESVRRIQAVDTDGSSYYADFIRLLTLDPRPNDGGERYVNLDYDLSPYARTTRCFLEITSPLELLALTDAGLLPVIADSCSV